MRIRSVLIAALLVPATLAPAAQAKLPKPKTTAIKPGKSIAGVKLDMSKAQVFHQWGSTHCTLATLCEWVGPGKPGAQERASVSFVKGKVVLISISAATTGTNLRFKPGTLSKWKTSKKIGLGSKKGAVHKAYPHAKANTSEGVMGYDLDIGAGPNLTLTRFSTPGFGASATRLRYITVGWDTCHYYKC